MRFLPIVSVLFVVVGISCSSPTKVKHSKPAILIGNDSDVREQLIAEIPIGTTQADAERIAKENALQCRVEVDTHTNEPYLSCSYSDKRDFWVTWVWQIRIDCPDGIVSDISCKQAGIGP